MTDLWRICITDENPFEIRSNVSVAKNRDVNETARFKIGRLQKVFGGTLRGFCRSIRRRLRLSCPAGRATVNGEIPPLTRFGVASTVHDPGRKSEFRELSGKL